MLRSYFVVCLLASAAVAEKNLKPYRFLPGQTYVYDYSARLQTGIPKISDQNSNFQVQADILIQGRPENSNEVRLKLTNVKVGQSDGSSRADETPAMRQWHRDYQRELAKPIAFTQQNGRVINFIADKLEPEWSINIKKSILSLFNLNLHPKEVLRTTTGNVVPKPVTQDDLTYFGVYEQGMAGECETTYELNQIPTPDSTSKQYLLNVTKVRNYENCRARPVLSKDNFSLQHRELHGDQTWSAVRGYYPVPYTAENLRQQQRTQAQEPVVQQYNTVKYNISLSSTVAIIESIFSEGRIVYNTFGDKIVAVTQQNVTLKNSPEDDNQQMSERIEAVASANSRLHDQLSFLLPNTETLATQAEQSRKPQMDIPHMLLYGQMKVTDLVRKMPEYFRIVTQEILSSQTTPESRDVMQRIVEIVNTFASLPRDALEELYRQIADTKEDASPEQKLMRKIFLDCLALCGTNDAAMLIKQKIVSHQVSSNEARELLEALPHNMYLPDVKTIDAFLELYQHPRVVNRPIVHTAAAVCFGKLVQIGNKKAATIQSTTTPKNSAQQDYETNESSEWSEMFIQKPISQEDVERYVVIAGKVLEQADSFQKKVAAIEALAHMGVPEALNSLKPYVTGEAELTVVPGYEVEQGQSLEKERTYLRTIAIYATAHIAKRFPKQVQPMVLPVYRNTAEPHQLRLAAFTIVMLCQPERHVLQSVAADLQHESDKQVTSFVASALRSVGNLRTPCLQHSARIASDASDSISKAKQSSKYSRYIARDYFDSKRNFGLLGVAEVVESRRSPIPKAAYLSLTEITGQFHEQMLEIGFNAKGLEKLVHRIVGRNGLISAIMQNKALEKTQKKNMIPIEEAVRIVRDKVAATTDTASKENAARLDLFFKLFERTSLYALDEAALYDLIDEFESTIDNWAKFYSQGYTGAYAKVFMPSSLMKVIPSELGLPVVVSHKNPLILSMKVTNAKLDRRNGFEISAEIVPKCLHSSYTFLFGVVPAQKTAVGTHVEKTTQASLPLKFRVAYKLPQNKWNINFQPKADYQIFYHKTEAKTFVSRIHVATTPSRDWLETAQSIRNSDSSSAKMEKRITYKNSPVAAHVSLETEEKLQDQKYVERKVQKNGIIPTIVEIFQNPGINAREVYVTLESQDSQSAFDYQWDWQKDYAEEAESSASPSTQKDEDDYYDSSEESHEQEWQDTLMGDLFSKFNKIVAGKTADEGDWQKVGKSAGRWLKKKTQSLKWVEDYKDYQADYDEDWPERKTPSQPDSCRVMRTTFLQLPDKVCFSTRPVLSCQKSCRPVSQKQVSLPFHCLPKSSAFTTQLMKDSERMVLSQLASKRVDFTRQLSVPSSCSA